MKHIQTVELNPELARIKTAEHSIISEKVCGIVRRVVTAIVLSFVAVSICLFVYQTLKYMPQGIEDSEKFVRVVFGIIQNTLITSLLFLALKVIFKALKWFYHKYKG